MKTTAPIYRLGYTPQSAVNRKIKNGQRFDSLFPPATNDKTMLKQDGEVSDTIEFMKQMVKDYNYQTAKIAEKLAVRTNGKLDEAATCKNIWQFVVDYIKYNLEKGEQLRTPSRTWHDAQIMYRQSPNTPEYSADCDCMALFVACILCNLNISCYFRITAYDDILGVCHGWQHVYVIANLSSGGQYIIDPVYKAPNQEKEYSKKEDYLITIMGLNGCDIYQLSGLGTTTYYEDEFGGLNGKSKQKRKEKKAARKAAKKEKKAAKKAIKKAKKSGDKEALAKAKAQKKEAKKKIAANRTGIAKAAVKVGKGIAKAGKAVANVVKKGTMLVPRSMFLLLLRLNFRGMAKKFANNQNAYSKFLKTWKKVFGGKEAKLKKAINKGKNRKALFGSKKSVGNLNAELCDIGAMLCGLGFFDKIKTKLNRLFKKDKQINGLGAISYDILDEGQTELGELGFAATAAVSSAVASATPIIKKAIDIFQKVNDAIPEGVKDAIKQGFSTQECDDDTPIEYDTDDVEEEDADTSEVEEEEEYEEE